MLRTNENSNLPLVGRSKFASSCTLRSESKFRVGGSASPWIGGDPHPKNAKGVFRPPHKGEVEYESRRCVHCSRRNVCMP